MNTLTLELHPLDAVPRVLPGLRCTEGTTGLTLDAIEKVKLQIVGLKQIRTRQCKLLAIRAGRYEEWRHEHQQFLLDALMRGVAEEWPQVRQVAESGDAGGLRIDRDFEQTGQRERFALSHLDGRIDFAGIDSRSGDTAWHQGRSYRFIDGADLGATFKRIVSSSMIVGVNLNCTPKSLYWIETCPPRPLTTGTGN